MNFVRTTGEYSPHGKRAETVVYQSYINIVTEKNQENSYNVNKVFAPYLNIVSLMY